MAADITSQALEDDFYRFITTGILDSFDIRAVESMGQVLERFGEPEHIQTYSEEPDMGEVYSYGALSVITWRKLPAELQLIFDLALFREQGLPDGVTVSWFEYICALRVEQFSVTLRQRKIASYRLRIEGFPLIWEEGGLSELIEVPAGNIRVLFNNEGRILNLTVEKELVGNFTREVIFEGAE